MTKRGLNIFYRNKRNRVLGEMKATKATKLLLCIEGRLLECPKDKLKQVEIANHFGYSKKFVNTTIATLVQYDELMEVSTKRYMWNPYITVGKKYRRKSTTKETYLEYKRDNYLNEVAMREFLSLLDEGKVIRTHRVIKKHKVRVKVYLEDLN